MSLYLIAKRIELETGGDHIVLINEDVAIEHGINAGDHIVISKKMGKEIVCVVDTSNSQIDRKHIGVYTEIYERYGIKDEDLLLISLFQKPLSVEYIKKKIKKHDLTYDEIHTIIDDIVHDRLGIIEKTYFLSTIYNPGYNNGELYGLTKSIANTGEMLHFDGIVADKHSVGGIAGKGITPLVVSIVSSFGVQMPNTSSRSITTPAGTTDILETVTNVAFTADQLKRMMDDMNAFMVWGGGFLLRLLMRNSFI